MSHENREILLPSTNSLIPMDDIYPKICSMQYIVNVGNRYVRTLITSEVQNLSKTSKEITFSVIAPENAFISEFEMEIDGKIYKAYVKEKEEARNIYQKAVSAGQSAAHVELSARDSKTFTVSVNVEPESKTIFRLVYEELLLRSNGQYELVVNIHPGQIVEVLGVTVHIKESRPLTFIKTASLRTGNEISKNDPKLEPSAKIEAVDPCSANVTFNPDISQQKKFAECLGGSKENGLAGQFVVQYDVERDSEGGEVLIRDGYFVHFFAPTKLEPLPKHVVFVLDHSGSMSGTKIDQLIEAMQNILSQLEIHDLFNIVRFSTEASVWNGKKNQFITVKLYPPRYGDLEPQLKEANLPDAVEATKDNIKKAKNIIKNKDNMNSTNIIAGLELGLFLIKKTREKVSSKYQPMIIFLTDGLPNEGMSSPDEITDTVTKINSGENRTAIFSLSFGEDADKSFLNKLSSKNLGFSKHIYVATDASLQLQDFYSKISSPLLSDVTFTDVDGASDVTKPFYPILFNGSELVVAGRADNKNVSHSVSGRSTAGRVIFNATCTEPVSSLERLWAYLTVKQLLNEKEIAADPTELTKKALELSLKYSFVTEVTSLVVVKPDEKDSICTQFSSLEDVSDIPVYCFPGPSRQLCSVTSMPDSLVVLACGTERQFSLSVSSSCFEQQSARFQCRRKVSFFETLGTTIQKVKNGFGLFRAGSRDSTSESITGPQVTVTSSLVIVITDPAKTKKKITSDHNLQINSMKINADVTDQCVRTQITTCLENLKKNIEEITFPIVLSENEVISEFEMEINGDIYKADVKERSKATKIYKKAVSDGQTAALIEKDENDSKLFTLSLNVQPGKKTIFRLAYQKCFDHLYSLYELVINIHPGQIVEDLGVQVNINRSIKQEDIKTLSLRKINKTDSPIEICAEIDVDEDSTVVRFNPDINQQKKYTEMFGDDVENGLSCQFVIEYFLGNVNDP